MALFSLFLLLAFACAALGSLSDVMHLNITASPVSLKGVAPAVTSLNLDAYLGYWYQMYADAIVINTIEKGALCATATYGIQADGNVSVLNYAKIGEPTASGTDYVISGYAYVPDATQPGELKVHFNSDLAPPVDAPYWVLELGPINSAGLYDWAIVSDNLSQFLFVLGRDVATFNSQYDATIQASLKNLGFTGYKKPIKIYQESDCVYNN
jgi:lipocalin